MDPEEEQQQQPGVSTQDAAGTPESGDGNAAQGVQAAFHRVTPEEAESLPYDELKRRMKEQRRLHEEGLLDAQSATAGEAQEDEPEDDGSGTSGQDGTSGQRIGGEGGGNPQDSELQGLLRQAQERAATLERERAEEKAAAERAALQTQHQRVEQAIASLPEERQALARQDYMNRLGHQALNDYHGFLQQREKAIQAAELVQARRQIPDLLSELADSVAQRHGLRNAEPLKAYVKSKEFGELLQASQTEEALTAAAANAGQWMEFLAVQQASQNAQQREQRRQGAATNRRVVRDTPNAGVPVGGGDMDLVHRINTMSKEDFFAWKKQQLREANARA